MALSDIGSTWQTDPTQNYFKQWMGSCLIAAGQILSEAANTSNHTNRIIWAKAMLSHDAASVQVRVTQMIRLALATNPTFQGAPLTATDSDVQFIVNSQIDQLALGS
jgi:hypothetical protein